MEKLLEGYGDYLEHEERFSLNTRQSYKRDTAQFLTYFSEVKKRRPETALSNDLEDYMVYLGEKGRKASSLSRALAALRSFYGYLEDKQVLSVNPLGGISRPKQERTLPKVLSLEEVERFLEQPDSHESKGIRDRAMLELLYATGIRATELIELNFRDVSIPLGMVRLRHGNRERNIPIGQIAKEALLEYLEKVRPSLANEKSGDTLFLNMSGSRMTRQGFWKIVKRYGELAHIEKEITPHMLRHSFAAHLLAGGADLKSIQEMMGYQDISSTLVYVRLEEQKLQSVYAHAHPRA